MNEVSTIGLDLAKNDFQVDGIDGSRRAAIRRQPRRGQMLPFFKKLPAGPFFLRALIVLAAVG